MANYKNISEAPIAISYPDGSSKTVNPGDEFLLSPARANALLKEGTIEAIALEPVQKKPRKGAMTDGNGNP